MFLRKIFFLLFGLLLVLAYHNCSQVETFSSVESLSTIDLPSSVNSESQIVDEGDVISLESNKFITSAVSTSHMKVFPQSDLGLFKVGFGIYFGTNKKLCHITSMQNYQSLTNSNSIDIVQTLQTLPAGYVNIGACPQFIGPVFIGSSSLYHIEGGSYCYFPSMQVFNQIVTNRPITRIPRLGGLPAGLTNRGACAFSSASSGSQGDNLQGSIASFKAAKTFYNIVYSTHGSSLKLDLYKPDTSSTKSAVLIHIHGGAWKIGHKNEALDDFTANFTARGVSVIRMDYQKLPSFAFPRPLQNVNCVLRWVYKEREKYGFDTSKIYIGGMSAGGHIALLYTLNSSSYIDPTCQYPRATLPISKTYSIYGPTDLRQPSEFTYSAAGLGKLSEIIYAFRGNYSLAQISPISFASRRLNTKFYFAHGVNDIVVPYSQSVNMSNQLRSSGNSVETVFLNNFQHGSMTAEVVNSLGNFLQK